MQENIQQKHELVVLVSAQNLLSREILQAAGVCFPVLLYPVPFSGIFLHAPAPLLFLLHSLLLSSPGKKNLLKFPGLSIALRSYMHND